MSRLTMAFGVGCSVGGISHCRFSVPVLITGEALTLKSEAGALSPTLLTVPLVVPGKVWPDAKLIIPLFAIDSPVSAGTLEPRPKSRLNLPTGLAVLFATGSTCQRKVSLRACPMLPLKADPDRFSGCEFFPVAAVAFPVVGNVTAPRRVVAPFTSSLPTGALVPMPTPFPVSKICELAISAAPSNFANALTAPPGVVTSVALLLCGDAAVATAPLALVEGCASRNAVIRRRTQHHGVVPARVGLHILRFHPQRRAAGLFLVKKEGHSDGAVDGFTRSVVQCSGKFHYAWNHAVSAIAALRH